MQFVYTAFSIDTVKGKLITIRVDDEMYAALKQEPNYSESIRSFIRDGLMKDSPINVICDICDAEGTGTKASLQRRRWEFGRGEVFCPAHAG